MPTDRTRGQALAQAAVHLNAAVDELNKIDLRRTSGPLRMAVKDARQQASDLAEGVRRAIILHHEGERELA